MTSLQDLIDREEIRALTATYNRRFDDQDADGWAALFVDDGELEVVGGRTSRGGEELRAMCTTTGYGTVHITCDSVIELDGDRATQVCTLLLARRSRDGGGNAFGLTGRYDDELIRTREGWRFRRRAITLDSPL